MWRTTRNAIRAVVEGEGHSAGAALWARHLRPIRERTVFEWHMKDLLAPAWGYPRRRVPGAIASEIGRMEFSRTWRALRNARRPRSEHNEVMEMAG
jgi:hypothetical protein